MMEIKIDDKIIKINEEQLKTLKKDIGVKIILEEKLLNDEEKLRQLYLEKFLDEIILESIGKIYKELPINYWLKKEIGNLMAILVKGKENYKIE